MAAEFMMPKLGLTMEEGVVVQWLAPDGADVSQGDAVLIITTDKTDIEVEAPANGRLVHLAQVGETYACGQQIGWFLADGEERPETAASSGANNAGSAAAVAPKPAAAAVPATAVSDTTVSDVAAIDQEQPSGQRVFASPYARRLASERGIALQLVNGTGPNGRIVAADVEESVAVPALPTPATPTPATMAQSAPVAAPTTSTAGSLHLATVAGRALADLLGIDLATVPPDPNEGRITRASVAAHVRGLLTAPTLPGTPSTARSAQLPLTQEATSIVPLVGMRGTIAKRMHQSVQESAQLTLFMDAEMDAVVIDREDRKKAGSAPSYTDYIIAATARALVDHPIVNSQVTDDGIALLPQVNVGMAVALENGLIVPVVHDTLAHDLVSLSSETSRLAEAARLNLLSPPDLAGGTFSVSTLGMFGVDGFTPIINPPNAAILGVGRLRDDIVLGNSGEPTTTKRATLSLTWDHRVFDGAPAAAFCQSIVSYLADPTSSANDN